MKFNIEKREPINLLEVVLLCSVLFLFTEVYRWLPPAVPPFLSETSPPWMDTTASMIFSKDDWPPCLYPSSLLRSLVFYWATPLFRFCNRTLTLLCCLSLAWLYPPLDWLFVCVTVCWPPGTCRTLTLRTPPWIPPCPGLLYEPTPVASTLSSLCVLLSRWA